MALKARCNDDVEQETILVAEDSEIPRIPMVGANSANKLVPHASPSPVAGYQEHVGCLALISLSVRNMVARLVTVVASALALSIGLANAHGSHSDGQPPSSDWATRHMLGAPISKAQ